MSYREMFKAGVSIWAISFALSIVTTIVLIIMEALMGFNTEAALNNPSTAVLGLILTVGISLLATFAASDYLLRRACKWTYGTDPKSKMA